MWYETRLGRKTRREELMVKRDKAFAFLQMAVKTFLERYDAAIKTRDRRLKSADKDYKGAKLEEEKLVIRTAYSRELETLRNEVRSEVNPLLSELRTAELEQAAYVDETAVRELSLISSTPLSKFEIEALRNKYEPCYWTDRQLAYLAEKNGVAISSPEVGLDLKISIIDGLFIELERALQDYTAPIETLGESSDETMHARAFLRPEHIRNISRAYYGGSDPRMDPNDIAEVGLNSVRMAGSAFDSAMQLRSLWSNSTRDVKNAIAFQLAKERFGPNALDMAIIGHAGRDIKAAVNDAASDMNNANANVLDGSSKAKMPPADEDYWDERNKQAREKAKEDEEAEIKAEAKAEMEQIK